MASYKIKGESKAKVRSFSSNIIFSFILNIATPAVALVTAPLLARVFGVEGRGMVQAAVAPSLLIIAVGALGLPDAIIYFVAKYAAEAKKIVIRSTAILFILGIIGAAAVWLLASPLAASNSELEQLLRVTALCVPLNFLAYVPRGLALGTHHWQLSASITVSAALLRLGAYLIFWSSGLLTPLTVVLILLLIPVMESCFYIPFMIRRLSSKK